MKLTIRGPLPENPRNLIRRLGYGETPGYKGEVSYQRLLGGSKFPRYHAYFTEDGQGGMSINLHVDQKPATYASGHAHAGEYEGRLVEQEIQRIAQDVERLKLATRPNQTIVSGQPKKPEKTSFWGSLFG